MSVAAVILAAGFSRRLGKPKQDITLGGETLIARAIRLASEAHLSPIIVVVNSQAQAVPSGCLVLVNDHAEEGMASSIRLGIATAMSHDANGVILMTCDQVALTASHLEALYAEPLAIKASAYVGKVGVPAYFPSHYFEDLLKLQGDVGARDLLRDADTVANDDLVLDIDTEEDFARAQKYFSR